MMTTPAPISTAMNDSEGKMRGMYDGHAGTHQHGCLLSAWVPTPAPTMTAPAVKGACNCRSSEMQELLVNNWQVVGIVGYA